MCGALVKTIELELMGFLSRAVFGYLSQEHDSMTVTVVTENLMRDSYPYADVLVPTSGLSLNSFPGIVTRSEERRVGKECRSRWSPYH